MEAYKEALRTWLDQQKEASLGASDPNSLQIDDAMASLPEMSDEQIYRLVRQLRPTFPIQSGYLSLPDGDLRPPFFDLLESNRTEIDQISRSVGCIEVSNLPNSASIIGTAWPVAEDILVTNRHVAEMVGSCDGGEFRLKSGFFGEPLKLDFNVKRELGSLRVTYRITDLLWFEPDATRADIAFFKIESEAFAYPKYELAPLASVDLAPGETIVTIGHPRQPASGSILDDLEGPFDIKRVSPGRLLADDHGWATHDCNSMGGNSGAAVVDLRQGCVLGLQFASPDPFKSYFIKASAIRHYLAERPWLKSRPSSPGGEERKASEALGLSIPIQLKMSVQIEPHEAPAAGRTDLAFSAPSMLSVIANYSPSDALHGRLMPQGPLRNPTAPGAVVGGPGPEGFSSPAPLEEVEGARESGDGRRVGIFYATSRERDASEVSYFTGERSKNITFGTAKVRIPERHRIGRVELPRTFSVLSIPLFEQSLDPSRHFIIEAVDVLSEEEWKSLIANSSLSEAFVFVHGFNVAFRDALYRVAQITWDLQYKGVPVLFSWPSRGQILDYGYDRESALGARGAFISVLKTLRSSGINRIHLLAHSMGNFLALDAFNGCTKTQLKKLAIGEMMMAAPDLDSHHYLSIAPKTADAFGATMYASAADRALLIAKRIAGGIPRAGDVPASGPLLVDGIDSIDVTAIGGEILGLGHSVFASRRSILNDIGLVMLGIRPPHQRLREMRGVPETSLPKWWRYVL